MTPKGGKRRKEGDEWTTVPYPAETSSETTVETTSPGPQELQTLTCMILPEVAPTSFSKSIAFFSFYFFQIELFCFLYVSLNFHLLLLFLPGRNAVKLTTNAPFHFGWTGMDCSILSAMPVLDLYIIGLPVTFILILYWFVSLSSLCSVANQTNHIFTIPRDSAIRSFERHMIVFCWWFGMLKPTPHH